MNAIASIDVQFGEWTKYLEAHVAGLAGYDAIIGITTLTDGDAVINVHERTIYFRVWNVTFHCEVPKTPPKGLKRWMDDKKGQKPKRGYVKAQKEEKLEKLVMPN